LKKYISVCALFFGGFFPFSLLAYGGDGKIAFYTYHLKERIHVTYRKEGKILPEGLRQIEKIFRSRDSSKTLPVDSRLVELLDQIEDHFGVRQIEVISGYRSTAFNRELKATGHKVANESFHTKAMAADIHLDEISEEALRDYVLSLKAGGVGYYPSLHMVHVDVGPVRSWSEDSPRKKWVGEKTDYPITLTVSPDRTFHKKLEKLVVTGERKAAMGLSLHLEFFDQGAWQGKGPVPLPKETSPSRRLEISLQEFSKTARDLPFGKYRFRATTAFMDSTCQYSNEFYFKKE
jgi:uncharacterized protein YcbK (DUF882 family)